MQRADKDDISFNRLADFTALKKRLADQRRIERLTNQFFICMRHDFLLCVHHDDFDHPF